jgi:hypothetical protein
MAGTGYSVVISKKSNPFELGEIHRSIQIAVAKNLRTAPSDEKVMGI